MSYCFTAVSHSRVIFAGLCIVIPSLGLMVTDSNAENEPVMSLEARPPSPRPDSVAVEQNVWPFVNWSYAKAYTYNFFGAEAGYQHQVFGRGKWNKHIRTVRLIDREQAKTVSKFVNTTKGSYETASCFFPRHGILYFDESDYPVAGVDICFECDGLRTWPEFEMEWEEKYGTYDEKADKYVGGLQIDFESILDRYKSFFKELGETVDYKKVGIR